MRTCSLPDEHGAYRPQPWKPATKIGRDRICLLSADIGKATLLAGDYTADERLAAFLLDLARRYASRGFSPRSFRLVMPRADVANHLRLAAETVSRALRRFRDRGLIRVDGREIELVDAQQLERLARNLLPG